MPEKTRTVEWEMMDKKKFIPLNLAGSFVLTASVYPFSLVKTRLQVQHGHENYAGMFDAFTKIFKYEGMRGFYKGFLMSCFGLISGTGYIVTYEVMRNFLYKCGIENSSSRGFIAGGVAALTGRAFANPMEVVTQRMMIMGQRKGIDECVKLPENIIKMKIDKRNALRTILSVISSMAKADGIKGFYRGFSVSLTTTVPAGALWWFSYHKYQGLLQPILPAQVPVVAQQCLAATLGGITTTTLVNPLDLLRIRLQVERTGSLRKTLQVLWKEEKLGILTKGLSAKLFSTILVSSLSISGYEAIKRLSVYQEYKKLVAW